MSIQFSGTLTEQDFNRFQQYCLPTFCKLLFKWFPWFWLGFLLTRIWSGYYSIDQLVFDLFILFYFFLFLPKFRERQIKRVWESSKILHEETSGVVDLEGLVWRNIYGEMRYPWEILSQYREQADFFMLYVAINQAIILPRSFFHSEEDWQQFRQLVTEKLSNQPNKKNQNRSG
jgi:YcxB-like protein